MKKLFFIITFLVLPIIAKAQVMYFILSGHSPDENNVDAFNTGTHTIPATYLPFIGTQSSPARYDENIIVAKHDNSLIFNRLIILQRTQKSIVCKTTTANGLGISFKYAFSLDFKTMVQNPDAVNPLYHTSIPVDRFVVRRSIDDLF